MTIFGRYVFRQAAGALVLILLSLSGVVWIALALRQLNLVTSEGQDAFTFIKMTTLALPNMMAMIAPVALLVAVMHTLNRLSGDSELIVLTASGANVWTVARPLLALGLVVAIAVSAVNHFAMPWSLRLLRDFVIEMRSNLISQVILPGRFSSPEGGLTIHIRDRELNGDLKGLLMHDARDPKNVTSYLAENGNIIRKGKQSFLLMHNGHVLKRDKPGEPPKIIVFESYVVDLDRFEAKSGPPELKPRERYFDELVNPPDPPEAIKLLRGQFVAEIHERFANPFYAFAFVLLAVALIGQAQSTRQNRWEATAFTLVGSIGARMGGLAANNLVVLNGKWIPVLYAIPLGLALLSVVLIISGSRPRRGLDITGRLARLFGEIAARVPRLRGRAAAGIGDKRAVPGQ